MSEKSQLWLPQHSNLGPSRVPSIHPGLLSTFPISLAVHPEIFTCAQDLEEVLSQLGAAVRTLVSCLRGGSVVAPSSQGVCFPVVLLPGSAF